MTAVRDPGIRRLAAIILLGQVAVTGVIAAIAFAAGGAAWAQSALAGGAIGILGNLFMTIAALRPTASAGLALSRMMLGQLLKVLLTVAMFFALARRPWVNWLTVFVAYVATLFVFWLVPVLFGPRLPPRSRTAARRRAQNDESAG